MGKLKKKRAPTAVKPAPRSASASNPLTKLKEKRSSKREALIELSQQSHDSLPPPPTHMRRAEDLAEDTLLSSLRSPSLSIASSVDFDINASKRKEQEEVRLMFFWQRE